MTTTDTTVYLTTLPTATEGYLTLDEGLTTQEVLFYNSKGSNFVTVPSLADRGLQGSTTGASAHASGAVVKMKTVAQYIQALANGNSFAAAAIPNAALSQNVAWTAYTPSWTTAGTAPAIGNGTITGFYQQIGKTVFFRMNWTAGSTTTFGTSNYRFSFPITPKSPPTADDLLKFGTGNIVRSGVANYIIYPIIRSGVTSYFEVSYGTSAPGSVTGSNLTNTGPATWANGDTMNLTGFYEAA